MYIESLIFFSQLIFFQKESILDFDKASPSAIGSSQPPSVTPASSPVGR